MRDFQKPGRSPVYATTAAVATSHPLASLAAIECLRTGGNAVDAAITAAATLAVVEPHMTGVGGDCFALYKPANGELVALNGSGRACAGATIEAMTSQGLTKIPGDSPHAVTIPGAVAGWCLLHDTYGRKPLDELMRPAIGYAENGYPIAPRVAADWAREAGRLQHNAAAKAAMLPGGAAPAVGSLHRQPRLAQTLRTIGAKGMKGFYEGEVAADIVAALRALGGLQTEEDFAAAAADFVTPISTRYRDVEVWECPPNGQGVIALLILNILARFDLSSANLSEADRVHLLAEATRQAYFQRDLLIGDPRHLGLPVETILSDRFAADLATRVTMEATGTAAPWDEVEHRDTVCFSVVDGDGNAVSFINSLFNAFGSAIMAPGSGVMLQNRGQSFRLEEGHPNALAPGKRPMHTIIPGMVMKDGEAVMPFGVMGGQYQATGHAGFLSGVFDRGLDPQAAIDAPRSFCFGGELQLEQGFAPETIDSLKARGHAITMVAAPHGGGQAVMIDRRAGVLIAGSDPRKDGCALGY